MSETLLPRRRPTVHRERAPGLTTQEQESQRRNDKYFDVGERRLEWARRLLLSVLQCLSLRVVSQQSRRVLATPSCVVICSRGGGGVSVDPKGVWRVEGCQGDGSLLGGVSPQILSPPRGPSGAPQRLLSARGPGGPILSLRSRCVWRDTVTPGGLPPFGVASQTTRPDGRTPTCDPAPTVGTGAPESGRRPRRDAGVRGRTECLAPPRGLSPRMRRETVPADPKRVLTPLRSSHRPR